MFSKIIIDIFDNYNSITVLEFILHLWVKVQDEFCHLKTLERGIVNIKSYLGEQKQTKCYFIMYSSNHLDTYPPKHL